MGEEGYNRRTDSLKKLNVYTDISCIHIHGLCCFEYVIIV